MKFIKINNTYYNVNYIVSVRAKDLSSEIKDSTFTWVALLKLSTSDDELIIFSGSRSDVKAHIACLIDDIERKKNKEE